MKIYRLLLLSILWCGVTRPLLIGSDIAVSKENNIAFPQLATNEIKGFAWMDSGFSLANANTTCLFNSFFPVRGTVALNGGTLTLSRDLIFHNPSVFTNLGNVEATNIQSLHLASAMTELGSSTSNTVYTFKNINIVLHSNISWKSPIKFEGNCAITGGGHILDLNTTGTLIIAPTSHLSLKDLFILNIHESNIRCEEDDSTFVLDNIKWFQDAQYTFTVGSISFKNKVDMISTQTFLYDSSETSTILIDSTWKLKNRADLIIGRKTAEATIEPLHFEDATSLLYVDDSSVNINANGIQLTKGTVRLTRGTTVDINSTDTTNGITVGDGTLAGDMQIILDPSALLSLPRGHIVYNLTNSFGFLSKAKTARIIRGEGFTTHFKTDSNFKDISVEITSPTSSFSEDSGVTSRITNMDLEVAVGKYTVTGTNLPTQQIRLEGNDSITIRSGVLPFPLIVIGTGNTISGEGDVTAPITLQDENAELTSRLLGRLKSSIIMNQGTVILERHLDLANGVLFSGEGTVNLNGNELSLGGKDLTWNTSLNWLGNNSVLNLNANVSLSSTWTFNDSCVIEGNYNSILLGTGGEILLSSNTLLRFHNVRLEGLSNENIRCLDDTGRIILDDVDCILTDDYFFKKGALQFKNRVAMKGAKVFAYQTSQTSTICTESKLKLDAAFTFSYDPMSNSKKLIEFDDNTAHLILNRSLLHTTTIGLQLEKGTLITSNDAKLASERLTITSEVEGFESALIDEGITFGDRVSSTNDFTVLILPGVQLSCTQGSLSFQNVSSTSLRMFNSISSLCMFSNTTLKIKESVSLPLGKIIFENNSVFGQSPNKQLTGSIVPTGKLLRSRLSS